MQIGSNALLAEMQSIKSEITPSVNFQGSMVRDVKNTNGSDFGQMLSTAVNSVNQLQKNSSDLATRLEMGDSTVTLSDTVIAREKSGVAFEATVKVRNKLVDAYKEIMSMSV
ncbi:MAG: flagellar hook-basal body complex protein FliE [Parashewanella sp.]